MGGSTGGMPGTGDSQIGNTGGTTGVGTGVFIPPPPQPQTMTAQIYNQNLQSGMTDAQMRTMRSGPGEDSPFLYNSTSPNQWNEAVTQAAMQSPTGRPLAGSAQFYQPVFQSQYTNYARPATQFDVSTYGTQPVQSPLSASGASRASINNTIGNYFQQNPNSDMNATLAAMRNAGINRTDIQQWGGVNNYGPQMSLPQMQMPFNPYTNSFGGGFMPQMQSPFSFQPQFQPQMGMGMQTPFSSGMSQPAPQRVSSGPARAIVSRSSGMRGTPNVMMRRAEGGVTSLMDDE